MKESKFWAEIKGAFAKLPQPMYMHRIENGVGRGQPDVNICAGGKEIWLELKVMKGHQIEIRHSQMMWLRRRISMGMYNTFVVARHKDSICVWRGETIHFFAPLKGRATDRTMVFKPPTPDFVVVAGKRWDALYHFLFS
jgi:hypothetical protein